MGEFLVGLSGLRLPPMVRVRQSFPGTTIADVAAAVRAELAKPTIAASLRPGMRVAVAVGSRGIAGLATIVTTLVAGLAARGVGVVIIPAMGSHGGASADGQREVLARLGVTEVACGAPIVSGMATTSVAQLRWDGTGYTTEPASAASTASTEGGALPVHVAADALAVDAVIPVVRIKPHTGFRGDYESGICKMLAIGLGKHAGCSRLHREGYPRFAMLIPAAARAVLATGKVAFALAVVENAHERTALVEAVPAARVMAREPELLREARLLMPRLLMPEIDVLVVERFGKDISGVGMDPNVTGRGELGVPADFRGPRIGRIVVLALTEAAGGNATGIGMADVITERFLAAIDRGATATNVLTSGSLGGGKIPLAIPGDDQAILAAASCVPGVAAGEARIVRVRDTLHLSEIAVSENLVAQARTIAGITVGGAFAGDWDRDGEHGGPARGPS